MATVDERVVGIAFDSSKFQSGIKPAIDGLDALKQSLNLKGATQAIDDLDAAGKKLNFSSISDATNQISGKFVAMATVGITALSNIVNKAVNAGESIVKSLTVDPIKAGLDEYELKMGSIQTILANTARFGTNLGQVTSALDELNTYADKTIYNFGDMTKNIGLFTNAGINIDEATSMIKGFSNEAAASGTTSAAAAGAAYQLSQAMSAGTIRLMDWRSLTNAGMGNKNMQNGLIEIADAMGTLTANSITSTEIQGNFNASLEKNWLSADVMSTYLQIMAGDMDAATQASLGLTDAQIAGFQKQQKTAEEAATKVRTYTQLMGTLREAVGSGWSESFDIIIGDFEEATVLFTNINNQLGGILGAVSDARNKLLQDFKDLGGRDIAIEAITNAWKALLQIIKPIMRAMEDIFPPITAQRLLDIVKGIERFTESLKITGTTSKNIERTAAGFFAILSIGAQIIGKVVEMLWELLGVTAEGSDGILKYTGNVGDFLVKIDQMLKDGKGLDAFFDGLGKGLGFIVNLIKNVITGVFEFIGALGTLSSQGGDAFVERLQDRLGGLIAFFQTVGGVIAAFGRGVMAVAGFFEPFIRIIGDLAKGLGNAISDSFSSGNFNTLLDFINTGLLAGIGVLIAKFVSNTKNALGGLGSGGGIMSTIKGVFGELGKTLQALQGQVKAKTLLLIAAAVGILTLSVVALSMIDTAKLFVALGAISVMFVQLGLAMAGFDKIFTIADAAKLTILAVALIGLATAMTIFATAVLILSTMSPGELAVGLIGLAGALAIVSGAMLLLSKTGPGALIGAAALTVASVGILLLAGALKVMGTLSWDEIGRGMVALGGSLAILAVGLTLMMGALPGAAALTIASVGILIMAAALKVFATLNWDDIGRAMVVLGGSLAILAVGLTLMMASLPGAAALVVASVALVVLGAALKIFATLSWEDIAQAMLALAGSLAIISVAMNSMLLALPGAAALLVVSAALVVLAGVLVVLGSMGWDQIGTALITLALSLTLLGIAGMAIVPAIPGLLGLGAAVLLLGVGLAAAGIGVLALSVGLTGLSVAGGAAILTLTAAISALASLIPFVAQQIGLGLIEIIKIIGENGPAILGALTTILLALIEAIVTIIPPLVDAIVLLVTTLVEALVVLIPLLVDAGMRLIIGILDGVAKNIGKVIEKGTDVIVAFMGGIGAAIPRLLQAGAQLILDFLNGIANTIRANNAKIREAGANIASAIIEGITGGITAGIDTVVNAARNMAEGALNAAKSFLGIASPSKEFTAVGKFSAMGLANGIVKNSKLPEKAAEDLGKNTLTALKKSMRDTSKLVTQGNMDLTPTIRPVLDLSNVRKNAGLIGGMISGSGTTLSVDVGTAKANDISSKYGEYMQAREDAMRPTTEVSMTQNIYSPKAVPAAEIYRQNNNQMSILKGELEKKDA